MLVPGARQSPNTRVPPSSRVPATTLGPHITRYPSGLMLAGQAIPHLLGTPSLSSFSVEPASAKLKLSTDATLAAGLKISTYCRPWQTSRASPTTPTSLMTMGLLCAPGVRLRDGRRSEAKEGGGTFWGDSTEAL